MAANVRRLGLYFAKLKKSITFLKRKAEVNYRLGKIFSSILRISLPSFPFEFSVEQASNRMIDIKRSNKGFKADSTFIYCFTFSFTKV
jgi:hypothetical protein